MQNRIPINRQITGGIDLDTSPLLIAPGDWLYSLNYNIGVSENGLAEVAENVSKNVKISYTLPAGTNRCVGVFEDKKGNTIFYFVYNSNGDHSILRYVPSSSSTGSIVLILQSSELNLTADNYINGIDLINDLLYWAEGSNPQRKINITKANVNKKIKFAVYFTELPLTNSTIDITLTKGATTINRITGIPAGSAFDDISVAIENTWTSVPQSYFTITRYFNRVEFEATTGNEGIWSATLTVTSGDITAWIQPLNYYPAITEKVLDVGKWPAWKEPTLQLHLDSEYVPNYIKNIPFQFRTKVYCDDYEHSALSPISIVAIDYTIANSANMLDTGYNSIIIDYSDEGRLFEERAIISAVEILVRSGNTQAWRSVVLLKENQLSGTYAFYNNGYYSAIGDAEAAKNFDAIPVTSGTQETVDGRINFGDNTEGYDSAVLDASLTTQWVEENTPTYTVSGLIQVWDVFDDDIIDGFTAGNYFGCYQAANEGFYVYLAGTPYYALTTVDALDHTFTITGVPPGRYIIRIASHLCTESTSTYGDIYEVSASNLSWQNTSTFVRGFNGTGIKEKVVEVTTANVEIFEYFVIDSVKLTSAATLKTGFGYVRDSDVKPPTALNFRVSGSIETTLVQINQNTVNGNQHLIDTIVLDDAANTATITILSGHGYSPGESVFVFGTVGSESMDSVIGVQHAVISSGTVFTVPYFGVQTNTFSAGATSAIAETLTTAQQVDHNGFWYLMELPTITYSGNTGKIPAPYSDTSAVLSALSTDLSPSVFLGNISPEIVSAGTALPGAGYGNYATSDPTIVQWMNGIITTTHQADSMQCIMNTETDVSDNFRTFITGHVFSQNNIPARNITVAFTKTGRATQTDNSGYYEILIYANSSSGSVPRNTGNSLAYGNYDNTAAISYDSSNLVSVTVTPIDSGGYNDGNPYIAAIFRIHIVVSFYSYPKHGEQYQLGIAYMDRLNRDNAVNTTSQLNLKIPFYTDGDTDFHNKPVITWAINSIPPLFATHYQWVRTKGLSINGYIQIPINDAEYTSGVDKDGAFTIVSYGSGDENLLLLYLKTLVYYSDENPASVLAYTFTPKDRVRFKNKNDGTYFSSTFDYEITGYDAEEFRLIVPFDRALGEITYGTVIEIYNPVSNTAAIYYEFGECYKVGDAGEAGRYHQGGFEGSDQVPGVSPATGKFLNWDTYLRQRTFNFYEIGSATKRTQIGKYESNMLSDMYESTEQSIGRVNAVNPNNRQVHRTTGMRFSNVYVPTGLSNGLSSFEPLNATDLDINYGTLRKLIYNQNVLLAICENKTFSVYIGKRVMQQAIGSPLISVTDDYYGSIQDLRGNYGTINPESVVEEFGLVKCWDAYRGVVWQYSQNGIDPIIPKVINYFATKGKLGIRATRSTYKVYGYYHRQFKRYVLTFSSITVDAVVYPSETFVYDDTRNRWVGWMSYLPETGSAMNQDIVTFKNGEIWLHTLNAVKNTFYGTTYPSAITLVFNDLNSTSKRFLSADVEASKAPSLPTITTPVNDWYASGQLSELLSTDFEFMNNKYWASFLQDKNTPNAVSVNEALINGEDLRNTILTIAQSQTETSLFWIKAMTVYAVPDPLTN